MSAEHMGMVFRADGIKGPEKLLLLAYTNWTDPYGYCWPSEERLAADCGTSVRTVRRTKATLREMNLLRSVRRVNRRTGDPISNLSRINLRLLASMARKEDETFDDDLIGQLRFDDDDQGNPEDTLTGTPDDPGIPGQSDSQEAEKTGPDLLSGQDGLWHRPRWPVAPAKMACGTGQDGRQSLSDPEEIPEVPLNASGVALDDADAAQPRGATKDQPQREDVEEICRALANAIEDNGSKRPTITTRWRTEARLLLDKDGRSVEQVLRAITWCQDDPFWRANILSMPKLREKYDQLRLQAQRETAQAQLVPSQPGAWQSTTDERVAGWLALSQQLAAEGVGR